MVVARPTAGGSSAYRRGDPRTIPVAPTMTRFFWTAVGAIVSDSEALGGPVRLVVVMRVRSPPVGVEPALRKPPRAVHLHDAASPHARSSRSNSIGIESASA